MKISGTVSQRCLPWKSLMVNLPTVSPPVASKESVIFAAAGIERHRGGEALEGRAHLEDADGRAVHLVLVERLVAIVGIVVRHRAHADHFAGIDVEHDADRRRWRDSGSAPAPTRRAPRAGRGDRARASPAPAPLPVGEASIVQVVQERLIDVLLHPGDALVVDIDGAEHMRGGRAARIEAPVLDAKADAGNAELVDRLLLARRDLALDVGELRIAREDLPQPLAVRDREARRREARSPRPGRSRSAARRRARRCGYRSRASRRSGRRCPAAPAKRRWIKVAPSSSTLARGAPSTTSRAASTA